jgi:hypothetical protein
VTDEPMDDRNTVFVLKEYSFSRQAIAVGMRLGKLRGVRLIRRIRNRAGEVYLLSPIYYAILIIDGEQQHLFYRQRPSRPPLLLLHLR